MFLCKKYIYFFRFTQKCETSHAVAWAGHSNELCRKKLPHPQAYITQKGSFGDNNNKFLLLPMVFVRRVLKITITKIGCSPWKWQTSAVRFGTAERSTFCNQVCVGLKAFLSSQGNGLRANRLACFKTLLDIENKNKTQAKQLNWTVTCSCKNCNVQLTLLCWQDGVPWQNDSYPWHRGGGCYSCTRVPRI